MIRVSEVGQIYALLPTRGLIAIDGIDGVGKSTLARTISKAIGAVWYELDAYANSNFGLANYTSSIRYLNLIEQITRDDAKIKIIDGIYIRDVLERAKLKWDIHIFCNRIDLHAYGNRHSYTLEDWDVEMHPQAAGYKNYMERHALPASADVVYEWEKEAE